MLDNDKMHPDDKRNLIIFLIALVAMWFVFDTYVMQPRLDEMNRAKQSMAEQSEAARIDGTATPGINDTVNKPQATTGIIDKPKPRADVIKESPRLAFENDHVSGTIALRGGRIDDLSLKNYYKTLDKKERVVLLSPTGTKNPKFVELGWLSGQKRALAVPGKDTLWAVDGNDKLSPGNPVTLVWANGQGLEFRRTFSLDDNYLITVTKSVTNTAEKAAVLFPYALAAQHGPQLSENANRLVHEGPLGYLDGELVERNYGKMEKEPVKEIKANSGWIALSDMYWFTSLIPDQDKPTTFRFLYEGDEDEENDKNKKYQVDIVGQGYSIDSGETIEHRMRIFSGAKELDILKKYEDSIPVRHFDLAVDFGILYFLTKPIFYLLTFLGNMVGNLGVAIIIMTIMIRSLMFPLANTSFKSFGKLKMVAPQMKELRDKYSDDKEKLQQELVKLYERENVNPMAGCFPILLQIPIFFALYKVLSVTIEMRHAPFFGWIEDLSKPDPTSVFNLFGMLPWDPPSFLMIGGWPCLMLLAMLVQRRLHPPSQDPMQQGVQDFLPFFMTYILSQFAAGLVIYWTFSNIFAVGQQYIIMKRMGAEVYLFKRPKEDKEMKEMVKKGPKVHPELEVAEDEIEDALFGHDDDETDHPEGEDTTFKDKGEDEPEISPPTKKKKSKKRNK